MSEQNVRLERAMTVIKPIIEPSIVFYKQLSHLSRGRIQELINFVDIIDGVAENIYDYRFVHDFSKLINSPCMFYLLHFYF